MTGTAVPGIELDDLAIWNKDVATMSEYSKKIVGDTCPPSIVDPFMFFDSIYDIKVFIDTCPLRINVTCIEDVSSMYGFFQGNGESLDAEAIPIVLGILFNETIPRYYPIGEDVLYKAAVSYIEICKAIVQAYDEPLSREKSESELNTLVNIMSHLLYPVMYKSIWAKVHAIHDGLPSMVQHLEAAALHMVKLTDITTVDLQFDLHFSNVYIMAKRFAFHKYLQGFTFPEMNYGTMNDTVGTWRSELDEVYFSHAMLKEATNDTQNMTVTLVAGIFETLHEFFPTSLPVHMVLHDSLPANGHLNSRVITSKMHPVPPGGWWRETSGLKFNYQIIKEPIDMEEVPFCMFWDPSIKKPNSERYGTWSDIGCATKELYDEEDEDSNVRIIQCNCTHMTTYAIVLKPLPEAEEDPHEMPIKIITYIGIIISMVTLTIFVFKVFALKQKFRDIPLILKNLTVALVFLHLVVAIAESAGSERPDLCQAMSILLHYLFCVCFCWLWMETLDLLYTITTGVMHGRSKIYVLFCWGLPLLPVIGICVISLDSYGIQPHCWIAYDSVYHLGLFGPIIAFLFFALLVSLINMCNIKTPALKDEMVFNHVRIAIRNNLILIPLLLVAWLLGYFALQHPDDIVLQYFSAIFYSFQGFLIVMGHIISNPYFYAMRLVYEEEKEESEEEEEEKESSRPPTARPESARPKTGKVGPILVYKP